MFLPSPSWRDWYHVKHMERARKTGTEFEAYFEDVMNRLYADYVNPAPAGSLGDGGCDGVRDAGRIVYACYGTRVEGERALAAKVKSDFERARPRWLSMKHWTFVTNASFGPLATQQLNFFSWNTMLDQGVPLNSQLG